MNFIYHLQHENYLSKNYIIKKSSKEINTISLFLFGIEYIVHTGHSLILFTTVSCQKILILKSIPNKINHIPQISLPKKEIKSRRLSKAGKSKINTPQKITIYTQKIIFVKFPFFFRQKIYKKKEGKFVNPGMVAPRIETPTSREEAAAAPRRRSWCRLPIEIFHPKRRKCCQIEVRIDQSMPYSYYYQKVHLHLCVCVCLGLKFFLTWNRRPTKKSCVSCRSRQSS